MKLGERVWIVGPPASGKTTLARAIREKTGLPHHPLDALYWQPDWRATDQRAFRETVSSLCDQDQWILDGHYPFLLDIILKRAGTVVWLDLPGHVVFFRLLARTVRRLRTREELWNKNRESLATVFGSDSIFRHAAHTLRARRSFGSVLKRVCGAERVALIRLATSADVTSLLAVLDDRRAPSPAP